MNVNIFTFNKCPILTVHESASAKFITNWHETDNSIYFDLCIPWTPAVPVLQGEGLYGALAEGGPLQEELVLPGAVGVLCSPVSWQGQPRHACRGAAAPQLVARATAVVSEALSSNT